MAKMKKNEKKWLIIGALVFVGVPLLLGASLTINGIVGWWQGKLGSTLAGKWSGGAGEVSLPTITINAVNVEAGAPNVGVTCDSIRIFDANWKYLGADVDASSSAVTVPGVLQNQNVWVYVEDSTSYPVMRKMTTPKPGPNPGTTSHTLLPDGLLPTKVRITTTYTDDALVNSTTQNQDASTYNYTASGATPTFIYRLIANELSGNTQDRWVGCGEYTEPEQQKRHVSVLVIRRTQAAVKLLTPGFSEFSDPTYIYSYKEFTDDSFLLMDYLPDGTYSRTAWEFTLQFEAGAADTVGIYWYDDIEQENLLKAEFNTALESASVKFYA